MKSIDGKANRRSNDCEPRFCWKSEKNICNPSDDRRVDADALKAAINLFGAVKSRRAGGLIFGSVNRDGSIDLCVTGELYEHPYVATTVIERLRRLVDEMESDTMGMLSPPSG